MKTKPNNSWEIEKLNLVKEISKAMSYDYSEYDAMSNNDTPEEVAVNLLDDFITKTLQQQREVNKDNLLNISMMIETVLGYLEMGNTKQAIKHLEVTQSMCYSDEELKLLQSLKQENK